MKRKLSFGYTSLYDIDGYTVFEWVRGGKKNTFEDHGIVRERPGGRFYAYCDILGKVSKSMTLYEARNWFDGDHADECDFYDEGEEK